MSECPSTSTGYEFLFSADYHADLVARVADTTKGDRIALATMSFNSEDERVKRLLPELNAAARRGVDVSLAVDAFSFMFDERAKLTGPLVRSRSLTSADPYFNKKREDLGELTQNGATVAVINTPRHRLHVPHAGRSHIKGAVINNTWRAGGCNLDNTHFADVMVGNDNSETADYLYDKFRGMVLAENVQTVFGEDDVVLPLDDTTDLIVDVGKRGQSEIYRRALSLIDNAVGHLFFTCQFFPGGLTGKRLRQAVRRDVATYSFFNGYNELAGAAMTLLQKKDRLRLPPQLFEGQLTKDDPFLHAKLAVSPTEALASSHNMINIGVRLGTAEIALHSTSPGFIQEAARMAVRCANKTDDPRFVFLDE